VNNSIKKLLVITIAYCFINATYALLPHNIYYRAFQKHYADLSDSLSVDENGQPLVGNRANKIQHILEMCTDVEILQNALEFSVDERKTRPWLCSQEYQAALTNDEIMTRIYFLTVEINNQKDAWDITEEELT
jgi:hypothetical protein